MTIDIRRLGPDAQRQIREQLVQQDRERRCKKALRPLDEFDSALERDYYLTEILPLIQRGEIVEVEVHKSYVLFAAGEFCGIKLSQIIYTPDFVIRYTSGRTEVIEVKAKQIRRMQRDYPLRRRLFIEQYARPCGWTFREIIQG